ncbi:ATP-binding protein [Streptomyces sp. NPDC049881]|uniref:ATP-binding protein n=1 Tax=Streptomyces sp. NPDC049881 TaxID=3155778 RepID=UPI00343CAEB7
MPIPLSSEAALVYAWDIWACAQGIETWRRTVTLVLRSWGASDAAVEVTRLGVSELLSNVARHVDDPLCRLSVVLDGGRVRVLVEDRSPCVPKFAEPTWNAESGRGLWMLRAMCQGFGCEPRADRKTMWFAVDLDPAEPVERAVA